MPAFRYLAQQLMNHLVGGGTRNYTPPANLYVGLSSTTPNPDGTNVQEPVGNGYARVAVGPSSWSSASLATPSVVQNSAVVAFPTASGDWLGQAPLTYFVVYDVLTGGNPLFFGVLAVATVVVNGATPTFPIGGLLVDLA